jgi:hypothetical protein
LASIRLRGTGDTIASSSTADIPRRLQANRLAQIANLQEASTTTILNSACTLLIADKSATTRAEGTRQETRDMCLTKPSITAALAQVL